MKKCDERKSHISIYAGTHRHNISISNTKFYLPRSVNVDIKCKNTFQTLLEFFLGCYFQSSGKELPVFRKFVLHLYGGIYFRHPAATQKA